MSAESTEIDHYEAVLSDLRAQRERIDQAIAAIEALRGGRGATAPQTPVMGPAPDDIEAPGAFHGLSIPEAAKKLLRAKRKALRNPEIVAGFKAGGFILGSKDPVNTVGAVLTRRANEVGDIVRVGRGTFGLKEWYPGRSFNKKDSAKAENGEKSTEYAGVEASQQAEAASSPQAVRANKFSKFAKLMSADAPSAQGQPSEQKPAAFQD